MPRNFCFLVKAEISLLIGGNCNACHPMAMAIGRLPGHLRANSGSISGHYLHVMIYDCGV